MDVLILSICYIVTIPVLIMVFRKQAIRHKKSYAKAEAACNKAMLIKMDVASSSQKFILNRQVMSHLKPLTTH